MLYFHKKSLLIVVMLFITTLASVVMPTTAYADAKSDCEAQEGRVWVPGGSWGGTCEFKKAEQPQNTTSDPAECEAKGGTWTKTYSYDATCVLPSSGEQPNPNTVAYRTSTTEIANALCSPAGSPGALDAAVQECAPYKQAVEECRIHIDRLIRGGGRQKITEDAGFMGCLEKGLQPQGISRDTLERKLTDITISSPQEEIDGSVSCAVEGVGWIICPVMIFLGKALDGAFNFISDEFLAMNTGMIEESRPYWRYFLNIANILFIVIFLIIIMSQISGFGVSNYGIKKVLPKLIVAAILINLSFVICQLLVDLSNVVGYTIKDMLDLDVATITTIDGGTSKVTNAQELTVIVLAGAGGTVALYLALPILGGAILAALVAVISVVFILIARKVIILLLVVVSPIAFLALVLPNTEKLYEKWKSLMISMLLLFPIIGLLFGASRFAASIMQTSSKDLLQQIISIVVLAIPLFAVYPLLKGALNATGKLGAAINGLSDKARGAAKGWGDESTVGGWGKRAKQNRMERRAAVKAGTYDSRWGKASPRNWLSRMNRGLNDNSLYNKATGGYGADQQLAAQALNRKAMKEVNEMVNGDDDVALAFLQSNGSTNSNQFRNLDETQQKQFRRMSDAGYHKKSTTFLALAEYLGENGKGNAEDVLNGLTKAQNLGADSVDVKSVYDNAVVNYRKSGRGDVMGELQALQAANATTVDANGIKTIRGTGNGVPIGDTAVRLDRTSSTVQQAQKAAWKSIDPGAIHRDTFNQLPDGTTPGTDSYQAHLNSDISFTQSALTGFDRMEVRAQNNARTSIIQAAQHHTGDVSIDTIEKAKAALLAQYGGARPTPQTPPQALPQQGGGNSPGNPPGGTQPPQNPGPAAPSPGGSPTSPFTNPPAGTQNWTQGSNGFYMPPGNNRRNNPPPPPPPPLGGP